MAGETITHFAVELEDEGHKVVACLAFNQRPRWCRLVVEPGLSHSQLIASFFLCLGRAAYRVATKLAKVVSSGLLGGIAKHDAGGHIFCAG